MTKPTVAVTIGRRHYPRMFDDKTLATLESFARVVHHEGRDPASTEDLVKVLPQAEACITSWGVARLDDVVIGAAPSLRAVAHMGSSVKRLVSPALWAAGIQVTSAGVMLARDVAETTLGLMIVGRKRIWPLAANVKAGGWREEVWDRWDARELHRSTVGIIGASNVGRHLITLLAPFNVTILLCDPFVSDQEASNLGCSKVELSELLAQSDIVSLHAPATEATNHLIDATALAAMKDGALLINTARGELIDEPALIAELSRGRLFAFLDVTDPEPPVGDSRLRSLPNVVVTPHIAGCIEHCHRMGETAVEELRRFFSGEPPIYAIDQGMLGHIA
jgi:phosphoglycerate dehydrogenase-like enzyme